MNQQQISTEALLDQLGADLTHTYGEIIARQARDLVIANAHVANLQARLGQAEASLSEMQRAQSEPEDGTAET